MKNQIEVRAYHKPSKLGRKFLGLPVGAWMVLALSAIVTAAGIGPSLTSTQTVKGVVLSFASAATGDVIEPSISYQQWDFWNVSATAQGGYASVTILVVKTVGLSCANAAFLVLKQKDNSAVATT